MNENTPPPPRFGQEPAQKYNLNNSFDNPSSRFGTLGSIGNVIKGKFSNPLFATGALLLAGVAFAGILMSAYPDGDTGLDAPIVVGEDYAYKEIPTDRGGMEIDNRDTTVFSSMDNERMVEPAPIENLLGDIEEPVDRVEAFARQIEESADANGQASGFSVASDEEALSAPAVPLKKIERVQPPVAEVASKPIEAPVRPKIEHKAGTSPEAQEYVKSALEETPTRAPAPPAPVAEKTTLNTVDSRVAAVQPAAGDATAAAVPKAGSHYVQLSSVRSMSGAEGEWGKLHKEFSAQLGSVAHRVKTADLGARGTFYRIQAGPLSKDVANQMCDAIKAKKPGGCLVVR